MRPITKPIILVGTGRCGSTVFHRLLATHPRLMWLSGFAYQFPGRPGWNRRAVELMGSAPMRRLLGRWIRANEQYRFWDRYTSGAFSEPCRDLLRSDVTARMKKQVLAAFGTMMTPSRDRLLVKITGWPRIGFLDEIFADAKFVHILRDGRSVASSLLHVDFWRGWYGPQGWRAGLLSPEDQATWEAYDRSFVALAGLEWRIQMRAIEAARRQIDPARFMEIRYESFCEQPMETYRRVLEFAELPSAPEFEREVERAAIRSMRDRWRDDLTPAQQDLLDELLADDLRRAGYRPETRSVPTPEPVAR